MEYVNYNVSSVEDVSRSLEEMGVAVLANQFSVDECEGFRNGIWRGIIVTQRFDVNNVATWSVYYKFQPEKSMLLQHWVGHLQTAWDTRQHETVCNLFAGLWNTVPDNLLVSFHGMSLAPTVNRHKESDIVAFPSEMN